MFKIVTQMNSSLNFCRSPKMALDHKLHQLLKRVVPWSLGYGSNLWNMFSNCWYLHMLIPYKEYMGNA